MTVAGVRVGLTDLYWVACGDLTVALGDHVVIETPDGQKRSGLIVVTQVQLARVPSELAGKLIEARPQTSTDAVCGELPGSDMPALGTRFTSESIHGTIVQIDVLGRRVAVKTAEDDVEWVVVPS